MAKQLLKEAHPPAKAQIRPTIKAIFWAGFLTCLTNPKAITFFVTLFSNFYVARSQHHFARSRMRNGVPGIGWLLNLGVRAACPARGLTPALLWINLNTLSGAALLAVSVAMARKGCRAIPSN